MHYILMHKDIEVLKFELNDKNQFERIIDILSIDHLPYSTSRDINLNHKLFEEWWRDRSIPITRDEYSNIENALPFDDSYSLVVKAHALSLDDQYWIRKEEENVKYDELSFFTNKFSNDIGDIIVGNSSKSTIDYYSPDSTSNGNLKKRWKIINGQKYLLKAGSKPYQYEIFNEVIASKVMDILEIEHVNYSFIVDDGHIYCASINFVNYNEDLVTAYQLRNSIKQRNDVSLYKHLLSIYKSLNIPDYEIKITQMLFIDYLLGNIDRHLNNFGVIRDAKTLEFLRVAPIYDTGSCLGFDKTDSELKKLNDIEWKPFQSHKNKTQLALIKDYSWLDIDRLKSIPKEIDILLNKFKEYISKDRQEAILTFITRRINTILKLLNIEEEINYQKAELSILEKDILEYIRKHDNELKDFDDLINETGFSYITIYRAVSNLTKLGKIKRIGARKNGYWIIVD